MKNFIKSFLKILIMSACVSIPSVCPSDLLATFFHSALYPGRLILMNDCNRLLSLACLGFSQERDLAGEQKQRMRSGNLFQAEGLSLFLTEGHYSSKMVCFT